jgi:hypothetical protein
MSSAAQILANRENSQLSTGPRTAEGKETSSRNALASGLFTARAFVRLEEREEYETTRASLWNEINPEGIIEETLATAILTAAWRLRRCGLVEANLAATSPVDPMQADPAECDGAARTQLSVDRARSQALTQLRHSLAELRRLQTEKAIRHEIFGQSDAGGEGAAAPAPDLACYRQVLSASHQLDHAKLQARKLDRLNARAAINAEIADLAPFCKSPSPVEAPALRTAA